MQGRRPSTYRWRCSNRCTGAGSCCCARSRRRLLLEPSGIRNLAWSLWTSRSASTSGTAGTTSPTSTRSNSAWDGRESHNVLCLLNRVVQRPPRDSNQPRLLTSLCGDFGRLWRFRLCFGRDRWFGPPEVGRRGDNLLGRIAQLRQEMTDEALVAFRGLSDGTEELVVSFLAQDLRKGSALVHLAHRFHQPSDIKDGAASARGQLGDPRPNCQRLGWRLIAASGRAVDLLQQRLEFKVLPRPHVHHDGMNPAGLADRLRFGGGIGRRVAREVPSAPPYLGARTRPRVVKILIELVSPCLAVGFFDGAAEGIRRLLHVSLAPARADEANRNALTVHSA